MKSNTAIPDYQGPAPPAVLKPQPPGAAWKRRAKPITQWVATRLMVRSDYFGSYGAGKPFTKQSLTPDDVVRHFLGERRADLIGLHMTIRHEDGSCWCKRLVVDFDNHGNDPDVARRNRRMAQVACRRARALGYRPLLLDSDGRGGLHVMLLFDDLAANEAVYELGKYLTAGLADENGRAIEAFPKQRTADKGKGVGNWVRLPGKHPTQDHWTRVWDDESGEWLEEDAAIDRLTGHHGDPFVPAPAIEAEPEPAKPEPPKSRPVKKGGGVVARGREAAYMAAAIEAEADIIAREPMGNRNEQLNLSTYKIAGYYGNTPFAGRAREMLAQAAKLAGLEDREIEATIESAWSAGAAKPRKIPEPKSAGDDQPPTRLKLVKPDAPGERFRLTDVGNADRFMARFGKATRFCYAWNAYMAYDGMRWLRDAMPIVEAQAKEIARGIYREAAEAEDSQEAKDVARWAATTERKERLQAMLWTARSGMAARPEEFDADPWALNVANGTINLRTAALRPHSRDDMLTMVVPIKYDPDATCPTWESFLIRILDRDLALVDYVQRLAGYTLTGVTDEQALPIAHGVGANGKSTLLMALMAILGPYAMKASRSFLMMKRAEHPTEMMDLAGKRLVVAVETGEDVRFDETLVKELTGSDRIRGRRMREDNWEFEPTHKVVLATNHKPVIKGTDHAIWRRTQLIPFSVVIPDGEQDRSLSNKLKAEYPGILAWAVRGCLEWQRIGLQPPSKVTEATAEYRASQDVIGDFLAECCVTGHPDFKSKAGTLYGAYKAYMEQSGEPVRNQRKFGEALAERGFERYTNNGTWYRGIGLRSSDQD